MEAFQLLRALIGGRYSSDLDELGEAWRKGEGSLCTDRNGEIQCLFHLAQDKKVYLGRK